MTPQLQQAIRLLQLSTIELQTEIQQALESNLMLEPNDEHEDEARADGANGEANPTKTEASSETNQDQEVNVSTDTIPDELPVDGAWEDIYDSPVSYTSGGDNHESFESQNDANETTLQDHLHWQMDLSPFSDIDRAIATTLIDSINEDGYLIGNLEEIHQSISQDFEELEFDEVEAVLHRIQRFDPIGVGARDIQECLLVQLQHHYASHEHFDVTKRLILEYLNLLGSHDYTQLMRKLKINEDVLRVVIELIQSLQPKPGTLIATPAPQYIVPDVFVRKQKGIWKVELNPDTAPRIRINSQYADLIRSTNGRDTSYLKNHLQEAKWFLKSLQSRNETLLKVATCIVERQRGFLEYGEEAMKPLVLRDIAETVEMHESTISRITTQKYMHTPKGIFEFKYFFSSHVSTTSGGECSATAIRALIKKLVAEENTAKPLSDSKLANLLLDQGINVARRTVAKYREALAIPPSNERKRLA